MADLQFLQYLCPLSFLDPLFIFTLLSPSMAITAEEQNKCNSNKGPM
ncbi:unnamed protein product [Arabidopsis halleri]